MFCLSHFASLRLTHRRTKDQKSCKPEGSPRLLAHKAVSGDPESNRHWFLKLNEGMHSYGFKPAVAGFFSSCKNPLILSSWPSCTTASSDTVCELNYQDYLQYIKKHLNTDEGPVSKHTRLGNAHDEETCSIIKTEILETVSQRASTR